MTSKLRSFDIFDTAITRTVFEPKDIFKLIENEVGKDFYNKRVEAEKKARGLNPYYTISDIYKFLPEFEETLEIETELKNCLANSEILEIYKEDPENSIFISDMYLPSQVLAKMLESVGYNNPKVFFSCEIGECNSTGKLFKEVEKLIESKIIIHYGDNYVADIEGAKRAKIQNVCFKPALHTRKLSLPIVKDPKLKKGYALLEAYGSPIEQAVIYVAPLVTEFTKWVLAQKKEGQRVFFLSRDMLVPYKLASEVLKVPDVHYIYASRKSVACACLKSNNEELRRRVSSIFNKKEAIEKENESLDELISYLRNVGIQDGDIVADIGYAGTIQAGIEEALKIKTLGLYMQVSEDKIESLETKMFLSRPAIKYMLMIETPMGSPEDCVIGYEYGSPVFLPENEERKRQAKEMQEILWKFSKMFLNINVSLFDVEQLLIHLQYYPNAGIVDLYNEGIYSNRNLGESIVGYDKEEIMKGNLRELYNNSYCKPYFKRLLEEDKEIGYLSKLI